MLIELDETLVAFAVGTVNQKNQLAHALNTLAIARREGNHFIFAEIEVIRQLQSNLILNELTKSILNRVSNRYAEKASMANVLPTRVVIGIFEKVETIFHNGKRLLRVPLERVSLSFVQKTYLLVENLADALFYKQMTENSDLAAIPIAFETFPGGGNTTADALRHVATLNRLCLCIVDGDVRYPGGPHGETAKKVIKVSPEITPSITDFYVLPVSSIENLIPMETLEIAFENDGAQLKRLEKIKAIYREDTWPFFGLKRGIRCSDVVEETKAGEKFWSTVIGNNELVEKCRNNGGAAQCKGKKCEIFIFNSLGPQTLGAVTAMAAKQPKIQGLVEIEPVKRAWKDVSALVAAWCCSGSPVYSG